MEHFHTITIRFYDIGFQSRAVFRRSTTEEPEGLVRW